MPTIEIDFEVYKLLTIERESEDVTYNEIVRRLLKLVPPATPGSTSVGSGSPWQVEDTVFPAGSEFLKVYKGKEYRGIVKDGRLHLGDGVAFSSPTAAAVHVAGGSVNGWRFWRCKLPGMSQYLLIERLRGKSH